MEKTNISHILHQLKQDYLNTAQSYVSSVNFGKNYDNDQLLADIGSVTIATTQTGYPRQTERTYHPQVPARRYMDTNAFNSYEKKHSKNSSPDDQYSSVKRRKHKTRHRVQPSSTIDVSESSNTMDRQVKTDDEDYDKSNEKLQDALILTDEDERETSDTKLK
ncbi:unnamed protein product [Rotaria sp. Silwood1]|nr:unnamed protein product [Rotaria sp. Silwood1]CAF1627405.1 unnamed protein product [Rotaria sp. Silwood1]